MSETTPAETLPALKEAFSLVPKSLTELMDFSKLISKSGVCPQNFKDKPGDVAVAISMGLEVGLKPLQAIQNIAVINGRPTLWGDAMKALVLASPLCEYFKEQDFEAITTSKMAVCVAKRIGKPEARTTFSWRDAERAGLAKKGGTWQSYTPRMMQMRARGFMIRDEFADIVKGLQMREEVEDYEPVKDAQYEVQAPKRKSEATQAVDNFITETAGGAKPEAKKPEPKTKRAWIGKIVAIKSNGEDKKNPRYKIYGDTGLIFHTFDKKIAKFLKEAGTDLDVQVHYEETEHGSKITSVEPAKEGRGAPQESSFNE